MIERVVLYFVNNIMIHVIFCNCKFFENFKVIFNILNRIY